MSVRISILGEKGGVGVGGWGVVGVGWWGGGGGGGGWGGGIPVRINDNISAHVGQS